MQYRIYKLSKKEGLFVLLKGSLLITMLSYLFFDSGYGILFLSPLLIFVWKREKKAKQKQRLERLNREFCDGMLSVSGALGAGYSVENAFKEALKDLRFLYASEEYMIQELQLIVNGLEMNQTIEGLLSAFADRSGLEDVELFAEVFAVCKRTGGNLMMVIGDCVSRISGKIEVYREIETYLSAKKLEQKIMNVMPMAILLYVRVTSPEFLEGLYGNVVGILVMIVSLLVYAGAFLLGERIMEIEI